MPLTSRAGYLLTRAPGYAVALAGNRGMRVSSTTQLTPAQADTLLALLEPLAPTAPWRPLVVADPRCELMTTTAQEVIGEPVVIRRDIDPFGCALPGICSWAGRTRGVSIIGAPVAGEIDQTRKMLETAAIPIVGLGAAAAWHPNPQTGTMVQVLTSRGYLLTVRMAIGQTGDRAQLVRRAEAALRLYP